MDTDPLIPFSAITTAASQRSKGIRTVLDIREFECPAFRQMEPAR